MLARKRHQIKTLALVCLLLSISLTNCSKIDVSERAKLNKDVLAFVIDNHGNLTKGDCPSHGGDYSYRCDEIHAHWVPTTQTVRNMKFLDLGRKIDTVFSRVYFTSTSENRNYFFIESTLPNFDCPACRASVGVVIQEKKSSNKDYKWFPFLLNSGTMGQADEIEKVQLGKHKVGFIAKWGIMGQGIIESGIQILFDRGDQIGEVLNIRTESSNEGICGTPDIPCWKMTATFHFDSSGMREFYDLIVKRDGTELAGNGSITTINEELIYRYKNGKYRLE